VLGADVVVTKRERLAQRELEHLLRARRERNLARGHLVALADDAGDLRAHLLDRDVQRLEDACSQTLLLAEQAEQDVLRADVVVLQGAGLVLGENDDLPGSFGEAFEQLASSFLPRRPRNGSGAHRSEQVGGWCIPQRGVRPPYLFAFRSR
jgi:hypothetical protein